MTGQVIKFGATGNYPSFPTDDNGTTITVKLMAGPVVAKQTVTGTATATGAVGDVAGAIKSDGTNLYVCTGAYDGPNSYLEKTSTTSNPIHFYSDFLIGYILL